MSDGQSGIGYGGTDMTRVTAGPYTLEIPSNGVAVLYEADGAGVDHQLPGGAGYLDALIQFAGEVIRLRAMVDELSSQPPCVPMNSGLFRRKYEQADLMR